MAKFSQWHSRLFLPLLLFVFLVFGLYTQLTLINWKPLPDTIMEDFKYYERALFNSIKGRSPYSNLVIGTGFFYPPPALFIVEIFNAFNNFLLKSSLYLALNIWLMIYMVYKVAKVYALKAHQIWYWYVLCLGFAPFMESLHVGQINMITVWGLLLLFVYEHSPSLSSLGLTLAVLTKVSPLSFFGYLVARREWKTVVGAVLMIVGITTIGVVRYKTSFLEYFSVLEWLTHQFPITYNSQSFASKAFLLGKWLQNHNILSLNLLSNYRVVQTVLTIYIAGLITISLFLLFKEGSSREPAFIITGLGTALLPNVMWYHHYVFLLLPVLIWMGWTQLDRRVVLWCLIWLLIAQVDRYHLTYGGSVHLFGHITMLIVLYQQMKEILALRQKRSSLDFTHSSASGTQDPGIR
ncbi:MAG: glycosyltransferase family 87 protein [Candidatus Methanomethylicaceae archaeon]